MEAEDRMSKHEELEARVNQLVTETLGTIKVERERRVWMRIWVSTTVAFDELKGFWVRVIGKTARKFHIHFDPNFQLRGIYFYHQCDCGARKTQCGSFTVGGPVAYGWPDIFDNHGRLDNDSGWIDEPVEGWKTIGYPEKGGYWSGYKFRSDSRT
jgi:hypothetical protein